MRLSQVVESYVEHKRSLGMVFRVQAVILRAFAKALGDIALTKVSPGAVRKFLDGTGPVTQFWFCKYRTLNGLYRFALARHYVHQNPLPSSKPQPPEDFQPYIYSIPDVQRLIDAAHSRPSAVWLLQPHTLQTLLFLLYGTGLRISEAVKLNLTDFDLHAGVLSVRETKFCKSRLVPVGADLNGVLRRYIAQQWRTRPVQATTPLLGTRKGKAISRQLAEVAFQQLRREAQVARQTPGRYPPRLHDFRHTFAVMRLITWYREGKDVQRLLPRLSTYLGHYKIHHTQRYLTMSTELLQEASFCFERYAKPEVWHA